MKIIIIGTSYPYRGGLAAYNERLAIELQQDGHDVTILTFKVQYPNFLFPGKTQYSSESAPNKLAIVRGINSVNPINWILTGNETKRQKPDLVIVKYWLPFMGPCFGTILRRIKKNGHSRIVTIVDNIIPHEARIGDKAFTRYFVKPVDGFVAMSRNVSDDIRQFSIDKPIMMSPHPIFDNFGDLISREEALTWLGLDKDFKYILFFGLIRKYKGLDLLIKAFADERFRSSKIKLIIAGEYYSDKEIYTNLLKEYSLEGDVVQIDKFIPDSEVKYFFCASDLVVQPYKSTTQSGVTQIAYHFNKPMVVTNVGGLAELCPDGKVGYVVPPNPNDIANAIIKFFEEADQKNTIENIIAEKRKYTWGILVRNILLLLDQIKNKQAIK